MRVLFVLLLYSFFVFIEGDLSYKAARRADTNLNDNGERDTAREISVDPSALYLADYERNFVESSENGGVFSRYASNHSCIKRLRHESLEVYAMGNLLPPVTVLFAIDKKVASIAFDVLEDFCETNDPWKVELKKRSTLVFVEFPHTEGCRDYSSLEEVADIVRNLTELLGDTTTQFLIFGAGGVKVRFIMPRNDIAQHLALAYRENHQLMTGSSDICGSPSPWKLEQYEMDDFEEEIADLRKNALKDLGLDMDDEFEEEEEIQDDEDEEEPEINDEQLPRQEDGESGKGFRIPKKSDFANAVSVVPPAPPIEEKKQRQRVRLSEELRSIADRWMAGEMVLQSDREKIVEKLPLAASVMASCPRVDQFLVGRADATQKLHVSEGQLFSLHDSLLNAVNALLCGLATEDAEQTKAYIKHAGNVLGWSIMDLVALRRDRLMRALHLDPASLPGLRSTPVERAINMNERSNEICPDILGPSLLKQLKDRGEGIAWMQKMQAKRTASTPTRFERGGGTLKRKSPNTQEMRGPSMPKAIRGAPSGRKPGFSGARRGGKK